MFFIKLKFSIEEFFCLVLVKRWIFFWFVFLVLIVYFENNVFFFERFEVVILYILGFTCGRLFEYFELKCLFDIIK